MHIDRDIPNVFANDLYCIVFFIKQPPKEDDFKYKTVIYMNRQTGKEMLVNLVLYHVYQKLEADEHKVKLNMTMPQFDERWNIVYGSLRHLKMDIKVFSFFFAVTNCQHLYCHLIVFDLKHALRIMWLPVYGI